MCAADHIWQQQEHCQSILHKTDTLSINFFISVFFLMWDMQSRYYWKSIYSPYYGAIIYLDKENQKTKRCTNRNWYISKILLNIQSKISELFVWVACELHITLHTISPNLTTSIILENPWKQRIPQNFPALAASSIETVNAGFSRV